jgi:enoyl-CoA hydratase/carnithine racemase
MVNSANDDEKVQKVPAANILQNIDNGVARLTLNQPSKGNALSAAMVHELDAAFDDAVAGGARLIVIEGAGRHLCTGFDLTDLARESDGDLLRRFVNLEMLLRKIFDAPVTTLAVGRGRVFGAGADLFAACDHRLALTGTSLSFPGSAFGIVLGTARLAQRIGRDRARELLLAGETVGAERALSDRLATQLLSEAELPAALEAVALAARRLDAVTVSGLHHATDRGSADAELAALCRSASRDGLKAKIVAYREQMLVAAGKPKAS